MPTTDDGTVGFADLGLRPELLTALGALGYEEPTPIQREAIPALLSGRDLLGQAATGTGKTAAFALPLLQRLPAGRDERAPLAIVLVPTRELAVQVSEAVHRYGRALGVRVLPIYGGQPIGRQIQSLGRGVDVVVATPGRVLDHLARETLELAAIEVVVLDEADEMLDMGFAEDIEAILDALPAQRQTVLFSATLAPRIGRVAQRYLREPLRISTGHAPSPAGDTPAVRQLAYIVPRGHKPAALGRVLDLEAPAAAIVFCRTRDEVDQVSESLNGRGYRTEALHGGMTQEQRDRVMGRLRSGHADLIVATDVAARGLDIKHLTHVVNYDVPASPDAYVHRIGRVGRAGREGVAITLAEPREHRLLKAMERATKQRIAVEQLPTVADLRARRLELTRAALEEAILDDHFDAFRVIVEPLASEYDVMTVALAAVKIAHEATAAATSEDEIPMVVLEDTTRERPRPRRAVPGDRRRVTGTTRLFINMGRTAGVRPQDLVGAIAGESSVRGKDVGAIEIADRFSLIEVPEERANEVIAALRATTIRGRRPTVRRERSGSPPRR